MMRVTNGPPVWNAKWRGPESALPATDLRPSERSSAQRTPGGRSCSKSNAQVLASIQRPEPAVADALAPLQTSWPGAGAAALCYGTLYEQKAYTLRRFTVPVLDPGTPPVKLLHISDLHMTPTQRRKQEWVANLARLEPDLVLNTGDTIFVDDEIAEKRKRSDCHIGGAAQPAEQGVDNDLSSQATVAVDDARDAVSAFTGEG